MHRMIVFFESGGITFLYRPRKIFFQNLHIQTIMPNIARQRPNNLTM